jgi:EAL domain-containing protein (putative c-di-GMP-specific phosphodiesterase class I)
MAEETGLIKQIGNWVFKEAARFCKSCSEQTGGPFQISINKSPVQFMARDAERDWLEYLGEQEISPSSISIEITEGVLLHASGRVEERLQQFRDAGVQLALDDFGTGYASMSYLQKFHIDYVKIDQSFVRDMTSNASSRTIAETIIVMAHKLGQRVIAEGVESTEQMACLASAGCDYAQGYLFSPPVSAKTLLQMLSAAQQQRGCVH